MSELARQPLHEIPVSMQTLKALIQTPTVPDRYKTSPTGVNDMYAATLYGRELGIGPMTAISQIFLVNGQASMMGQLMLALVWRAGHMVKITIEETQSIVHAYRKVDGVWVHVGDVPFTIEDAATAELVDKDTYMKYPKSMLTWRAVSLACRLYYPDVIVGVKYVPEELNVDAPDEPLPEFVEVNDETGAIAMETAEMNIREQLDVTEVEVVEVEEMGYEG